jgi:uncharacterized membrane protein
MKTNETPKMKADEAAFSATFVIVLLLIVPSLPLGKYGGGIAMLATAILGLAVYAILFKRRLQERGQWKFVVTLGVVSFTVSAAIAAALVLLR